MVASHLNFKIKIKKGGGNIFSIQNLPTKFDLHLWGRALYCLNGCGKKNIESYVNFSDNFNTSMFHI